MKSTRFVFSGDLGQPGRPILQDPSPVADADILVIESTCGNRRHNVFVDSPMATEATRITREHLCDAGRIRHPLRHDLPRREGSVRIFGEDIAVRTAW